MRVYPSTTTSRVGPKNLRAGDADCTIETIGIGVVATSAIGAPITPKFLAMAVTPPDGFDVTIRLQSSAYQRGAQWQSRGLRRRATEKNGSGKKNLARLHEVSRCEEDNI